MSPRFEPGGTALAVASAKGGVGKTTTSINLAAAFARDDLSVIVVEADLAMANVVDFLRLNVDFDADEPTLHDVLAGTASVETAVYEAPGGIDVLPSDVDLDGYAAADPNRLPEVIETLRDSYDVIIVDTGAGLSQATVVPLGAADRVILVSTPRVAAVRDTKKTIDLAERAGGQVEGVVFAKSGTGTAPPVQRIAMFLAVDLLGHIPDDASVPESQDAGSPVVTYRPASPAASAYRDLAGRLARRLDLAGDDDGFVFGSGPPADEDPQPGVRTDGPGRNP